MSVTSYFACGTTADDAGVGTLTTQNWNGLIFSALAGTETSADDGAFAGWQTSGAATSHWCKCTNFSITGIPAGSTIDGIESSIRYLRGSSSFAVQSTAVKFVKGGTVSGNDIGGAGDWPTSETTKVYGGATEKGGLSWTVSDVTASNFGIAFSVTYVGGMAAVDPGAIIDFVQIRVYYTSPNGKQNQRLLLIGIG